MWGWYEHLTGPTWNVQGYRPRAKFWGRCIGKRSSAMQGTQLNKIHSPHGDSGNYTSFSSKNPPILNIRPKCTSLTLLLHRMTTFGRNGQTFHWTCHPLPPPHRRSTPHWFLMAVFWQGAQLKRKWKRLLCPGRQKKGWEIIAKWAERVTNSTDSCLLLHSSHLKMGRKEGESCLWCF